MNYLVENENDAVVVIGRLLRQYGSGVVQNSIRQEKKQSKQCEEEISYRRAGNFLRSFKLYRG